MKYSHSAHSGLAFSEMGRVIKNTLFILLLIPYVHAQPKKIILPDSLRNKSYDLYKSHISVNVADSSRSLLYAKCWLEKSKRENDFIQMSLAYKALLHNAGRQNQLRYADSIISSAMHTNDDLMIGSAFMTKGIVYYDRKQVKEALNNYLVADEYISRTEDNYLIHKIKYGIGITKYYLGFYDEAISLLKECLVYFEQENDRAYLNSLHALGLCYNRIGKYDLASSVNTDGIAIGREFELRIMEPYFLLSEGVNQNSKKNYGQAIKLIRTVLPEIAKNKDFANESVANFYIADSYWSLNQKSKALPFLLKVDAVFKKEKYIRPDLRKNYELLIDYYAGKNNKELELFYVNRLLSVDSILTHEYKYLSSKIFKQYDTKKLLKAKSDIERSMQRQKVWHFIIIALLTVFVGYLIFRHYANQKIYRQRFEELMNRKPEVPPVTINITKDSEIEISPDVVSTILKNLEKFEKNKRYLDKDMNLVKLASILNTNTKYASKVILHYRGKKIIEYISDLKIDHIVELLKAENKYRNYTNKALGEEAGFGSTQNFTRAFNTRNGISPTYFIQQLQKNAFNNQV